MGFTFSSLGSKDALSCINDASMNYVTSRLHSGMCESKLRVYRELKEDFEYKKYFYGVTYLLFRFRSGTHSLNEELGRHSIRNSSKTCVFCEFEFEPVEHVLWECSEYGSICDEFISNLNGILQNDFHLKSSFDKTKYIFDQSIWKCNVSLNHCFQILRLF